MARVQMAHTLPLYQPSISRSTFSGEGSTCARHSWPQSPFSGQRVHDCSRVCSWPRNAVQNAYLLSTSMSTGLTVFRTDGGLASAILEIGLKAQRNRQTGHQYCTQEEENNRKKCERQHKLTCRQRSLDFLPVAAGSGSSQPHRLFVIRLVTMVQ